MEKFLRYQKVVGMLTAALVAIGTLVLLSLLPANWGYALGLLWGGIGGLIGYRLKVLAVVEIARNPQAKKKNPAKVGFQQVVILLFFMIVAGALNYFVGKPQFAHDVLSLWTTLAGLVLPNLVLVADALLRPAALEPAANDGERQS
ncbi:hypothetical protein FACS1894139_01680 [Planctomycetales bacterium]|nr:hypothetical protein FACS1894139_01680 [Planctomycetales bacterium]